jgi:predicted AAA+ superfamily ATPase
MQELLDIIASDIGSLTNPLKIANTFMSEKKVSVHQETIKKYLDYFEDSFLISKAKRYDIKGRKYINTPVKYYFSDVGLRNARLNFRQIEETHLMENIIYNELLLRGYNVDVGVVDQYYTDEDKKRKQKKLEVDFVCNQGSNRLYIQSALSIPDKNKMEQEQASLIRIKDSFRKIIIVKDGVSHFNEEGIYIMNLFDFLLNKNEAGI